MLALGTVALASVFSACSEEEEAALTPTAVEVPACLPITLPDEIGDDNLIRYTYNDKGRATQAEYVGSAQTVDIIRDSDDRLVSIGREGDRYYIALEYSAGEIKEALYYQSEEDDQYHTEFIYTNRVNEQGLITGRTIQNFDRYAGESSNDEEFTYDDRGNIVTIVRTDNVDGDIDTITVTYDDKVNPYHTVGFELDDYGLFNYKSLSKNNPVSVGRSYRDTSPNRIEYEYDEQGNPVKTTYYDVYKSTDADGNVVEIEEGFEGVSTFECR